ncbi:hypothetical protein PPGU19_001400 [Paraburkholderia sp. PGU19]|uniref:DEAD/DEAH box helicase family protein n=1 Tax=Paraburkholderia sp. PGU19 TaxID=2735434 RepID=UPI0015DAE73D|nr:DEAD/DEAH box helicase family protein [Paraburkholderia sp. PGU19]BCF95571.1 hypothetical protein PPGU19_001400 [Paraburkholderia sp. PGU19]
MSLIINSPYERPQRYWRQLNGSQLELIDGRRPAAYEVVDTRENRSRSVSLDFVNRVRERVDAWREAEYPGITTVTRELLAHWHDRAARTLPFYFCQLEAIETLIWWVEAAADFKQGIYLESDGGLWERICNKMATGSGKTTVMAMIITWQVLNALAYPKRNKDFSRAIFIVAPGLTVRERLQVLQPAHPENYYDAFGLCPSSALRHKLNQVELLIENWHALMPLKEPERSVVKKGVESDEAFTRRILGKLASYKNIAIINDEAHHAYRQRPENKISKKDAEEFGLDLDEATRWVEGLDRLHKTRGIARCFDLSATPFVPSGRTNTDAALFGWIVSDFGLNDAIEGGLVKTPRIVVRDSSVPNAQDLKPKLYHLYREPEVQDDLNRKAAQPHEALPKLVQDAYTLLGADWRKTAEAWAETDRTAPPPVMLTVCNRTETAARIEYYFTRGDVLWPELKAPDKTLRVDSRVLEKAEIGETATLDSLAKDKMAAIVNALCKTDAQKARYKAAKRVADKLSILAELCAKSARELSEIRKWPNAKIEEWLFNNVSILKEQRDYFSSAKDYEVRLHEIVRAAGLSSDVEAQLLDLNKEELLREIVDNVGKRGKVGQRLQSVISVAMLSEGWDAKNVTHIMGLRAFTSQLLCEQVIGRGLRRVSYETDQNGLFMPEYVNVFGVPLSIFQNDDSEGVSPPPPKQSFEVQSLPERNALEIRWPNVLRVDPVVKPVLDIRWDSVDDLILKPEETLISADIAPALSGATGWDQIHSINLERLDEEFRLQRLVFLAARKAFEQMKSNFSGQPEYLTFQLVRIVEQFIASAKLQVPSQFHAEPLRKRILMTLNVDTIVQHLLRHVFENHVERVELVFDEDSPIGSTRDMRTWYTTKPNLPTRKSQVSRIVGDSAWEGYAANVFEGSTQVFAYVKNDHLGFQIRYMWNGSRRRYLPDFLIRLANGKTLVLEIKGEDDAQNRAKRSALDAWVTGVNQRGGFGVWCWDVAFAPGQIHDIVAKHS